MDPLDSINPKKDTTLAFMLEAQLRGWQIAYMEMADLFMHNGHPEARMRHVNVFNDTDTWFEFSGEEYGLLSGLDIILMRKDPPFDIEYVMATYILEKAEAEGVLVVNKPQSLRDVNEKVFTAWFPQCCPPSILTRSKSAIKTFLDVHRKIAVKPTHKMGGQSVFIITKGDPNTNVIIEEVTQSESCYIQAQVYIPEIATIGDKRIILIDGVPVNYGITRMPNGDDHRGNLAAGASANGFTLTERDHWICNQLGPTLKERGLLFVGIDVIGEYLTEINVTSPTGICEINKFFDINIASMFFDTLNNIIQKRHSGREPK